MKNKINIVVSEQDNKAFLSALQVLDIDIISQVETSGMFGAEIEYCLTTKNAVNYYKLGILTSKGLI